MRQHLEDYVEVLGDKLKNHHHNAGTAGCETAVEERRNACIRWGLLEKKNAHLVKTLFDALPVSDQPVQDEETQSDQVKSSSGKRPAAKYPTGSQRKHVKKCTISDFFNKY